MEKRTSAFARIFAAIALIGAVVVVIAVISSSLGGGSGSSTRFHQHGSGHTAKHSAHRSRASSYVVKSGDTLVSIAHMTGVPVAEIQKLNPEVDPQILIAGEKLKLR